MDDYSKYEEDCKRIRQDNNDLLNNFEAWLKLSGLAEKTIKNHRSNIDFYINEYLLNSGIIEAKDGIYHVGGFLGDWFIRKAMWSSPASIRSNVASMKKFYHFLSAQGLVSDEDLELLGEIIKNDMPIWLASASHGSYY